MSLSFHFIMLLCAFVIFSILAGKICLFITTCFHLNMLILHLSDLNREFSMFCSSSGDSLGDQITSLGPEKEAQDGNSVTLSCNYSGTVYNLLWYRQYQRSKPELLLYMTESGDPVKADPSAHWFSAKVDKHRKLMELEISPAKVTDSALYYCALQPTVTGNLFPQYIIFLHISLAFH